jgi:hypothetical protein
MSFNDYVATLRRARVRYFEILLEGQHVATATVPETANLLQEARMYDVCMLAMTSEKNTRDIAWYTCSRHRRE